MGELFIVVTVGMKIS